MSCAAVLKTVRAFNKAIIKHFDIKRKNGGKSDDLLPNPIRTPIKNTPRISGDSLLIQDHRRLREMFLI
jgi:hypothetical protein